MNPLAPVTQVLPGGLVLLLMFCMLVVVVFVHISFALAVLSDAADLRGRDRRTALVNPLVWGLATLIGGVFVGAVYWGMHHSTLAPSAETH